MLDMSTMKLSKSFEIAYDSSTDRILAEIKKLNDKLDLIEQRLTREITEKKNERHNCHRITSY